MTALTHEEVAATRLRLLEGCRTLALRLRDLQVAEDTAAEVHAIRKLGKTLRGGLALFRLRKAHARGIQAVGRLLSDRRDAASRLSTWGKLDWNEDPLAAAAIAGLLEQHAGQAACNPAPAVLEWASALATAAGEAVAGADHEKAAKRASRGLARLRKQVSRCCRRLHPAGIEEFHQARKALKAYLGAVGFLPPGALGIDPVMIDLAELLGDENDLATLAAWLDAHGFTARLVPGLWRKMEKSRFDLRRRAMADSAALA